MPSLMSLLNWLGTPVEKKCAMMPDSLLNDANSLFCGVANDISFGIFVRLVG